MAETANLGMPSLATIELPERYRPVRRIARGGMATVWCVEDLVLGRQVAIKLLAAPYSHSEEALARFKREARAAARLSGHSNVVTIYDVAEAKAREDDAPRAFLVMEYLAGGTVAEALRAGAIRREEAARWLREAASALDYAHARGVIHRDIKPANFLLDGSRRLHVADFGIAHLGTEHAITASGYVLGTAAYLAPERALGKPASTASDRYALAVAAFELLVGRRPFTADHLAAQARAHIDAPRPRASERNPALPPGLDAVLARGMAKQPEQRWPTATEFAGAVDRALGSPPRTNAAAAPPPPPTNSAPLPPRRRAAGTVPPRRRPPSANPIAAVAARVPRRSLAIAALGAVAFAAGIAAGADHSQPARYAPTAGTFSLAPTVRPRPHRHHRSKPLSATSTATPTGATTRAAQTSTPPTAATLQARGHQLMLAGDYQSAIPVLRRALAAASPSSLTYAYALFDLGRSLRLAGDPGAAIPILYRRLQIPNQTGVVRAELRLALQAAGAGPAGAHPRGPGAPPAPPGQSHGGPAAHNRH